MHLWSLGVEEQFYLVWPPLMVIAAMMAARWRESALRITALILGASVALAVMLAPAHEDATRWRVSSFPGEIQILGHVRPDPNPSKNDTNLLLKKQKLLALGAGSFLLTAKASCFSSRNSDQVVRGRGAKISIPPRTGTRCFPRT
jgi:peptidoglycan/LPS O-acetylase OafA/YrhL